MMDLATATGIQRRDIKRIQRGGKMNQMQRLAFAAVMRGMPGRWGGHLRRLELIEIAQ